MHMRPCRGWGAEAHPPRPRPKTAGSGAAWRPPVGAALRARKTPESRAEGWPPRGTWPAGTASGYRYFNRCLGAAALPFRFATPSRAPPAHHRRMRLRHRGQLITAYRSVRIIPVADW
ncbi:hypothetical protein BS78_04G308400 [Paspalum vaginatum]|nr:hypothetical protein BS78_04G308400 [Paspalum vaginatum]